MINLKEHVVVKEGIEYVPLTIAEAAVAAAFNSNKIDEAVDLIQQSLKDMNDSLNDALIDD